MLVYNIGDVVAIAIFCVALIFMIGVWFIGCLIQFFDWIRRKRK